MDEKKLEQEWHKNNGRFRGIQGYNPPVRRQKLTRCTVCDINLRKLMVISALIKDQETLNKDDIKFIKSIINA